MTSPVDELEGSEHLTPPVPVSLDDFTHHQAAHCESGVTAALISHAGLPLTEPMAFGLGAALFFGYVPFVKIMGLPLVTFRTFPGTLFKTACKRLGVTHARQSFTRPAAGMRRLDQMLEQGRLVGCQANIFWLDYIPRPLRIHFNAHNLMVVEKRDEHYVVSDPVVEDLFACSVNSLRRARFSGHGRWLSRGPLYHVTAVPQAPDLRQAVQLSLRDVCNRMLRIPRVIPCFGLQAIHLLSRHVRRWPDQLGGRQAHQYLANVVRMQEEIGTGGAGFRYLFAAFLQEAGQTLRWNDLAAMSARATDVGDAWRRWALHASRVARGKPDQSWDQLADGLLEIATMEEAFYRDLDRVRINGAPQITG